MAAGQCAYPAWHLPLLLTAATHTLHLTSIRVSAHVQGYGVYVFSSGQRYEGHWEKGKKVCPLHFSGLL